MKFTRTATALGVAVFASNSLAEAVLYHNFSRVDVIEQAIVEDSWMLVEDGIIQSLGEGALPAGFEAEARDMGGRYAMPGLIDAHAHITAGPHRLEVIDGRPTLTIESVDEITRFNALSALAHGVTTVRNPGGDTEANAHYDEHIASGEWTGPTALHAGRVIQPSPFGGSAFAHPDSREAWFAEARRQAEAGMRYFKLYVGLSEEELRTGIEAAHAHGLQAIAHLDQVSWTTALDAGIDGLEHALPTSADLLPEADRAAFEAMRPRGSVYLADWFRRVDFDSPEMQALFAILAERQTALNLTLLVNEMIARADALATVVDETDLATMHPDNWAATEQLMSMGASLWQAEDFEMAREALAKVREFARRLFEAGIPLMIGTDGNGSGPLMAKEMQLHRNAGIPAWDVLALATHRAAETMGLDRVGRIAPGFEADVAFLDADPVASFEALKAASAVIVDGRYYTRDALLAAAREFLD
ncbi:amidohydrolase family protein [Wenzhouxiangella marina]|uniref:Uncharacterized protein n=1 Tax=Wenzhouxiangella marina TaxID=1579979 RepID=A0A0K0XZF0_9GAMM|nr:amidohydrolase family protein [Wenzhouxiangella marina]AKS43012.1 hypothetical protein WM2015_2654 [Wenzhouxiangella marina]MBB6087305.1 imidazolonepropionase-like amidohydrolase [Wenzhouxiangella marina]